MNAKQLEAKLRKDRKYTRYKNSIDRYINLQKKLNLTDEELIHYMYGDLEYDFPDRITWDCAVRQDFLKQFNLIKHVINSSSFDCQDSQCVYESKDKKIKFIYHHNYMVGMGSDHWFNRIK